MAWIMAAKELGGIIYLTRLPKSQSATVPGVPDGYPADWFPVGPGTQPSVQEYNGTQYILTFNYLSHLFTRIIDTATWPPTQVVPVTTPVPYPGGAWEIELPADALAVNLASSTGFGLVAPWYNPPTLNQPLLFLDPIDDTYSVTLTLTSGYVPQFSVSQFPYYQLWYRAIGTQTWMLLQNWTRAGVAPTYAFSYLFSNVGSLRYQFSLIWGAPPNPTDQWNPNDFEGGAVGATYVTVDSNVQRPSYQAFITETLTLDRASTDAYAIFGERQLFIVVAAPQSGSDEIQLSKSLVGGSTDAFASFGERAAFIFLALPEVGGSPPSNGVEEKLFPKMGGITPGANNYVASTCSLGAYIGN
jgi:hypothetical protein